MFGQQKKKRKMSVADAFEYLIQEEENKLLDMDQVTRVAGRLEGADELLARGEPGIPGEVRPAFVYMIVLSLALAGAAIASIFSA